MGQGQGLTTRHFELDPHKHYSSRECLVKTYFPTKFTVSLFKVSSPTTSMDMGY